MTQAKTCECERSVHFDTREMHPHPYGDAVEWTATCRTVMGDFQLCAWCWDYCADMLRGD